MAAALEDLGLSGEVQLIIAGGIRDGVDAAKALGNGMQIEEIRQADQPLRSRNNLGGVWQGPGDERRALKIASLLRSAL